MTYFHQPTQLISKTFFSVISLDSHKQESALEVSEGFKRSDNLQPVLNILKRVNVAHLSMRK